MPGSNERSVQLVGSNEQIKECVEHFLDDIGKVREESWGSRVAVSVGGGGSLRPLPAKEWVPFGSF